VKGVNQVDFSWANTQIDPNTIVFRVVPRDRDRQTKRGQAQARGPKRGCVSALRELPTERGSPRLAGRLQRFPVRSRVCGSATLLGNLTKSFNYRRLRSPPTIKMTLTLSEYIRMSRTSPTRRSARPVGFGGIWPRLSLKPIRHQRNQRDA